MQIVEYKTISMRITDAFGRVDKNGIDDDKVGIHNRTRFDYVINNNIKDNWQPLGQPFVILDEHRQQINQTMVKYAEKKSPLPAGSYLFGEGKGKTKVWDVENKEWVLLSEVMLILDNDEQKLIKWLSRKES